MQKSLGIAACMLALCLTGNGEETFAKAKSGFKSSQKNADVKKLRITYDFDKPAKPSAADAAILREMEEGIQGACETYTKHAPEIKSHVTFHFSPGTPTADGSSNGNIRLGTTARNRRVCMHEIAHTLGVGTHPNWERLVKDKVFTGKNATAVLREITHDKNAVLHADRQHFWPYGLNFDAEVKSEQDYEAHCKIVSAIIKDLER